MKTQAAILMELGRPLELVDLEIPPLKPGQVLVRIDSSGVCHTQVLEARGHRGPDAFLPHALGHEAAGVVMEVGSGVTKVKPDDLAILSWIKGSGMDVPGTTYRLGDRNVNAGAITTFQKLAVISENRLTPVRETSLTPSDMALIGCAIPTGVGAAIHAAQIRPGESVAIFGVGGVGMLAMLAAILSGASPVIAVDTNPTKLELAKTLGADHAINAKEQDPVVAISKICPGGSDAAIEATGVPSVMAQAVQSVRMRGGRAVIIGNAHAGQTFTIDPKQFNLGKRILGTWGGDSDPDRDYPRYVKLLASGKLPVAALKSEGYALADVNRALDDLESGRAVRPIIRL